MDLRKQIKKYYLDHLSELDKDKRFHFASRLASWQKDSRAFEVIDSMQGYITGSDDIPLAIKKILKTEVRNVYAKEQRQKYFDKYPALFGIHNALFRIRHLDVFYRIDAREELLKIVSYDELENLYKELSRDEEAIRILSRFAIDYFYLFELLFERPRLDPELIYRQKSGYDMDDPIQRHLFVYLFTHAIIADSNFYHRAVPHDRIDLYRRMLVDLERLFREGRSQKMDTRFEFLVTCRICEFDSPFFEEIEKAAAASLGPGKNYVIEPTAPSPSEGINDLNRSEHRNVLFIMSGSPYEPASAS